MTRKTFCIVTIAAAVFCMVVASASATHVQCGDTITTATTLDGDVVCPNGAPYGLRIGADNVLLRLNGYAVRAGSGTAPTPGSGIISGPDQDGLSGVRIKRGAVQGFENGVDLGGFQNGVDLGPANDTTVFKVTVSGNPLFGIDLVGDRNRVLRSVVEGMGERGRGIRLVGNDAYAWGNVGCRRTARDRGLWGKASTCLQPSSLRAQQRYRRVGPAIQHRGRAESQYGVGLRQWSQRQVLLARAPAEPWCASMRCPATRRLARRTAFS